MSSVSVSGYAGNNKSGRTGKVKNDERIIKDCLRESIRVHESLFGLMPGIIRASGIIRKGLRKGKKVIVFGNGGSAADAQHFVAEFVCKYEKRRAPQRAVALTTNTSSLTSISNDFSYEVVFSRQLEALALKGDIAIAISTSGNSPNVIRALKTAAQIGVQTISLTGYPPGRMKNLADINIAVPSGQTARIQEAHILILHIICKLIESDL